MKLFFLKVMQEPQKLITYYAPAERVSNEKLKSQCMLFLQLPQLKDFVDAVPNIFMILNEQRQIVYANSALLEVIRKNPEDNIYGLRPGEAISCKHSFETEAGCGTSEACETCGAVNAILSSLDGKSDVQECRIEDKDGNSHDFRVWTTPYEVGGQKFAIFSLSDISDEKRRNSLERIFFHDILNTAGGLRGFAELLKDAPEDVEEFKDVIYGLSERIIDEIRTQKILLSAEKDELVIQIDSVQIKPFIDELSKSFTSQFLLGNKKIAVMPISETLHLQTDRTLLWRVILNMVKNALEASNMNNTVTIGVDEDENYIVFKVHNTTVMPREVQLQIFQRSFSTKGVGRGIGTYSMKLLGEKYLGGKVYFESKESAGTTFYAKFRKN